MTRSVSKYFYSRRNMPAAAISHGCLVSSLLFFSVHASAQVLEEILVTAERRTESLQDVAISVTAVTGKQLDQLRLLEATDVAEQVPNLVGYAASGNSQPLFSLRGVTATETNPSANTPVPVYLDDVLLNNITSQALATFDMDRLEVLRGPQGTLFGYNASAGVIRFLPSRPTEELEASVAITAANYDELLVDAVVSGPLTDNARGRVSLRSRSLDGFQDNFFDGTTLGESETLAFRGMLDVDISERISLGVLASLGDYEGDGRVWNTEQEFSNFTGEMLPGGRDVLYEFSPTEENETGLLSATLTYEGEGFTLTSVTAYVDAEARLASQLTEGRLRDAFLASLPYTNVQGSYSESEQISQEFRIASRSDSALQYVAGVYYMREELDARNWFFFGDEFGFYNIFGGGEPSLFTLFNEYSQEVETFSAFGQIDYAISDVLTLTAGLRINSDSRDLDLAHNFADVFFFSPESSFVNGLTVDPADVMPSDIVNLVPGGEVFSTQSNSWDEWSGRLGIDYRLSPNTLTYASISKGLKSGSYNTIPFVSIEEANVVDPEELYSYEIGIKSESFDSRLRFNAAAFFYDIDNYQQKVINEFGLEILAAAESSQIYGVEVEVAAVPVDGLSIQLGLGWNKGEYDDYDLFGNDFSGNTMIGTDALNLNGVVSYAIGLGDMGTLVPQVDFSYLEGSFQDPSNTAIVPFLSPDPKSDDITLVNARLRYLTQSGKVQVALFVENINDELSVVARSPVASVDSSLTIFTQPRRYGITVSLAL